MFALDTGQMTIDFAAQNCCVVLKLNLYLWKATLSGNLGYFIKRATGKYMYRMYVCRDHLHLCLTLSHSFLQKKEKNMMISKQLWLLFLMATFLWNVISCVKYYYCTCHWNDDILVTKEPTHRRTSDIKSYCQLFIWRFQWITHIVVMLRLRS